MPERVKHLFEKAYKDAGVGTESNVDRTRYSIANQCSRTDINQSEYTDEASDKSGAFFITFSNDYVVVRNYMKESAAGKKTDPPVEMSLCCRRQTVRQRAAGLLQG